MKFVLLAWIMGSLITSTHESEEQCEGRRAMLLKESKVTGAMCVKQQQTTSLTSGTISFGNGNASVACRGSVVMTSEGWKCP